MQVAKESQDIAETDTIPWEIWRPKLVVFVRTFGGQVACEAEDIAQDIVLRAIGRIELFDRAHEFSTWIYRIARNHCIDLLRKARKRATILAIHAGDIAGHRASENPVEYAAQRSEIETQVARAVENLNPRDRRIAFLRFYEDLTVPQIAGVLEEPDGTIKYRLHVITRRLRRKLSGFGGVHE